MAKSQFQIPASIDPTEPKGPKGMGESKIESKEEKEFGYWAEFANVTRDDFQGGFGNRPSLDQEPILESFTRYDGLVVGSRGKQSRFGGIEVGGADPQVTTVFRGKDFTETYRRIRQAAPHSFIRPLMRGSNCFMLVAVHEDDLGHIIEELAEDTASERGDGELLRIKVFDSQGNLKEVDATIRKVVELRQRGYPVTAEIAIPYSNGIGADRNNPGFNPYPDEFFVNRVIEAARKLRDSGIPLHLARVSLKDMVGEMDATTAERLTGEIVKALKAEGIRIPFGLHLHDTGLAAKAYAAAIEVCQRENWPITVDTVEGHNTGFASTLEVDRCLRERQQEAGVPQVGLDLAPEQRQELEKIGEIIDAVQEAYKLRRVPVDLSGEDLRRFKIPGGGFASFVEAVKKKGFDAQLGISTKEAVRLVGEGLIAVGVLMGYPFAVTPGFQNKQIAALHLVEKLIKAGRIRGGMSYEEMVEALHAVRGREEDIRDLFVNGLPDAVRKFLTSQMPQESLPQELIEEKGEFVDRNRVSKASFLAVRKAIPLHPGLITDGVPSKLLPNDDPKKDIKKTVKALYKEGYLMPTSLQALSVLQRFEKAEKISGVQTASIMAAFEQQGIVSPERDGQKKMWRKGAFKILRDNGVGKELRDSIMIQLRKRVQNSAIASCLLAENPDRFRQQIEDPWRGEPDASRFDSAEAYADAMRKCSNGLDPSLDIAEKIRMGLRSGKLALPDAKKKLGQVLQQEQEHIRLSVLEFMEEEREKVAASIQELASGESSPSLEQAAHLLYERQLAMIAGKRKKGQQYLYSEKERLTLAFGFFQQEIAAMAVLTKHIESEKEDTYSKKAGAIKAEKRAEIESSMMRAPSDGQIVEVHIKFTDGEKTIRIKEGDDLYTINVMKMHHTVKADRDCIITELLIKTGDIVTAGETVIRREPVKREAVVSPTLEKKGDEGERKGKEKKESVGEDIAGVLKKKIETQEEKVAQSEGQLKALEERLEQKEGPRSPRLTSRLRPGDPVGQKGLVEEVKGRETKGVPGYNRQSLPEWKSLEEVKNAVHVVLNRAGCAVKIKGDLMNGGCKDVYVMSHEGDATTPLLKGMDPKYLIPIADYMDQPKIITALRNIVAANPGRVIALHPGWGFLSENPDFVKLIEDTFKGQVRFMGPNSTCMAKTDKLAFRQLIAKVAPEMNPPFFDSHRLVPQEEEKKEGKQASDQVIRGSDILQDYVAGGFNNGHILDRVYREEFKGVVKILPKGGDLMLKAKAGGGGRGIEIYHCDDVSTLAEGEHKQAVEKENYERYVRTLLSVTQTGERLFKNGEVMVEKRIMGNIHHLEVQCIATNGMAATLGLRNCTVQSKEGQKFIETNVIQGDYPPRLIERINDAARQIALASAMEGYEGLGTYEMLVVPNWDAPNGGEIAFLEINPRLQVEHGVTEEDIFRKTGKKISLPLLNAHLLLNQGKRPLAEILQGSPFGLTAEDIVKINIPGEQRVMHVRVNAKRINLLDGSTLPNNVEDDSWLGTRLFSDICREHKVDGIQGGIGRGECDSQAGSIVGPEEEVLDAVRDLQDVFTVSQIGARREARMNLPGIKPVYEALYLNEDKTVNDDFSTRDFGDFMDGIAARKVHPPVTRSLFPGEFEVDLAGLRACFAKFKAPVQAQEEEKEGVVSPRKWVEIVEEENRAAAAAGSELQVH